MAQFDVYLNPNPASRAAVPFVVDVQSGLIDALPTRLAAPLSRVGATQVRLPLTLCPVFEVDGEPLTFMPQLIAAIDKRLLCKPVASVAQRASDIVAALDAVVSGF